MAQGQILSFFIRLNEIENNAQYLDVIHKVFKSFFRFDHNSEWLSYVDEHGYLWLEEYPTDHPAYTLNGMIFAMFGVYDYYRIFHDDKSKELLKASLTTIRRYIPDFRNKDGLSFYCLKHRVENLNYHRIHIEQLKLLYSITEDSVFKDYADMLQNDYDPYKK